MTDYITIKSKKKINDNNGDDFPSMGMNLLQKVNIKVAIFIFIFGIILFSDIFVKTILKKIPKTVDALDCPNTRGSLIQLIFLVIGYIIIDILVQGKFI